MHQLKRLLAVLLPLALLAAACSMPEDDAPTGLDDGAFGDPGDCEIVDVAVSSEKIGLMQDLGNSVLVTTQATLEAVGHALGHALDLRRFRTNIHVELDAPAYAEEGWEGRRLHVGGLELQLLHPCVRCAIPTRDPVTTAKWPELLRHLDARHETLFGINGRVLHSGRVGVGEAATTEPPASRR